MKISSEGKPNIEKNKMGRPTKYKEEYCDYIIAYFEEHLVNLKEKKEIPFLSKFARHIKVTTMSLLEWSDKYPDFSCALKEAKKIQKECLITGGLNGTFNPTAFIFTAKNIAGMRDVQEIDNTHKGKIEHEHKSDEYFDKFKKLEEEFDKKFDKILNKAVDKKYPPKN